MQETAYIALGSNLGDRLANCRAAVHGIAQSPRILFDPAHDAASLYDSLPHGGHDQPNYLNTVIRIRTLLTPRDLLQRLLEIEESLGRTRPSRWCSRTIDLDLLLYGELIIDEPDLIVPHPRLHERRFVLEPLAELAGDIIHPVLHRTVTDLAVCRMRDDPISCIRRLTDRHWLQLLTAR